MSFSVRTQPVTFQSVSLKQQPQQLQSNQSPLIHFGADDVDIQHLEIGQAQQERQLKETDKRLSEEIAGVRSNVKTRLAAVAEELKKVDQSIESLAGRVDKLEMTTAQLTNWFIEMDEIKEGLRAEDPRQRRETLKSLGKLDTVTQIKAHLYKKPCLDPDPRVRATAISMVHELDSFPVRMAFYEAAINDPDQNVRTEVIKGLRGYGATWDKTLKAEATRNNYGDPMSNWVGRCTGIRKRVYTLLFKALEDPSLKVKHEAVEGAIESCLSKGGYAPWKDSNNFDFYEDRRVLNQAILDRDIVGVGSHGAYDRLINRFSKEKILALHCEKDHNLLIEELRAKICKDKSLSEEPSSQIAPESLYLPSLLKHKGKGSLIIELLEERDQKLKALEKEKQFW